MTIWLRRGSLCLPFRSRLESVMHGNSLAARECFHAGRTGLPHPHAALPCSHSALALGRFCSLPRCLALSSLSLSLSPFSFSKPTNASQRANRPGAGRAVGKGGSTTFSSPMSKTKRSIVSHEMVVYPKPRSSSLVDAKSIIVWDIATSGTLYIQENSCHLIS